MQYKVFLVMIAKYEQPTGNVIYQPAALGTSVQLPLHSVSDYLSVSGPFWQRVWLLAHDAAGLARMLALCSVPHSLVGIDLVFVFS